MTWRFWLHIALLALAFSIAGCTSTSSDTPKIQSIEIAPLITSLPLGINVQMSATAFHDDGSKTDISHLADWSTSDPTVSTINTTGTLTPQTTGSHQVKATYQSFSAQTELTIGDATLSTLNTNPTNLEIAKNTHTTLNVIGVMTDGTRYDVSDQVTWSSSDENVISLTDKDPVRGTSVFGAAIGNANLTATLGSISSNTPINVVPGTLIDVQINYLDDPITIGDIAPLQAIGVYAEGYEQDITQDVTWDIPPDNILAVASNSLITQAAASGETTISVSFGDIKTEQTLTISKKIALLEKLEITNGDDNFSVGENRSFQVIGIYSDNTTKDLTETVTWSVENASILQVSNNLGFEGDALALQAGTTALSASLDAINSSISITTTPANLLRIEISRNLQTIQLGTSLHLTATGIYSDGSTKDISHLVTWLSLDKDNLHVSNQTDKHGFITALSEGEAQITATLNGIQDTVDFTVDSARLITINIEGMATNVHVGNIITYRALGVFSNGKQQDISHLVTWTPSSSEIALNQISAESPGTFSFIKEGSTTINATYKNVSGEYPVQVLTSTIERINIQEASSSLPVGSTYFLQASAIYSDGTSMDITSLAQWQTDNQETLSISNSLPSKGEIKAIAAGESQIHVSYLNLSESISITVTPETLKAIEISPQNIQLEKVNQLQLTATGIYSDNIARDITSLVLWSSDDPLLAFISNSNKQRGTLSAISAGTAKITATLGAISSDINLTVNENTLDGINILYENNSTLAVNTKKRLTVQGNYSNGTSQNLTHNASWQTASSLICSVSNLDNDSVSLTAHSSGLCTVSVSYADANSTAFFSISENQITDISITPTDINIANGSSLQLVASGVSADNSAQNLTHQVTWSTTSTNIKIDNNGLVSALQVGSGTVKATLLGISKEISINVNAATLESISISPDELIISETLSTQLTATGLFSDESTQDITQEVLWESSNQTSLHVSNSSSDIGLASALSVGESVITASIDGISQTINATVNLDPTAPKSIALNAAPFVILNNGEDSSLVTIKISAIDDASVIADNTLIDLSILEGTATLDNTSILSNNGEASFSLQSTTKGLIRIEASIRDSNISNTLLLYSTDNFAEVIALGALVSATVTDDIVQTGGKFGLLILNYANRPFNLLEFKLGTQSEVIYSTSAPEYLSDNVLSPGEYVFNGWQTEKERENSFLSFYILREPLTGITFPVGVVYRLPSNN